MMVSTMARAKKTPAPHLVSFVRALPEPAPKSASVAAPPKAWPMPASFLGNCTSTSKIKNKQSSTSTTVNKPMKNVSILLNRVFHDVRETANLERRTADERAIHIGKGHQLAGVGRFNAATILYPHLAGNRLVKHFCQLAANEGVGLLSL